MKKLVVFLVCGLVAGASWATTVLNDAVGDLSAGPPTDFTAFTHLDIVSLEVMNDATDIMFTIKLSESPLVTDWGKYMVAIDSGAGGDAAGNGWGRPISMSAGMDYWIGTWIDSGGGAETYSWDGAAWILDNATYAPPSDIGVPVVSGDTVKLTTTLASLGLSIGDTFDVDVFSSGGGGSDGAIDALSDPNPSVLDWGDSYDSTSTLSYTVIPEPATLALVALGALAIMVRRRR